MTSNCPIEIVSLRKEYKGFFAVDDLSLNVEKNSFTGFLGPNGAGKSTTLKILTHLTNATSGEAYINGIDVTKNAEGALSDVGTVLETPEFYSYLTPVETMTYLGKINGMTKESLSAKIPEILEKVKMEEWGDKRIGTFSKGMKQRIAIGQSLLTDPSVIIFDEPTSGLDPRGMIEVRGVLKSLKTHDLTIFMSSHMLYEVSDLCDRVALINHGKLIVHDTTERIMNAGGTRVVKIKVINHSEVTSQTVKDIGALTNVESVDLDSGNIEIHLNGGDRDQASLLKDITAMGLNVYSITNDNLESIYLDLIKESR
ncbi:trehalose/maltose import ATP-binding protein MalK [Candidatus Methanoplasma termitum]|uniref:MalK5 protein n=1 Tax=Candidatus Methanoplasma termitum TaxID=1577791 RepID=A0A0A7LEG1_9ARCH|nr:ABC transporter ATP-binding protein [Candidatus Methanoplasma termitum]AIZ56687.1 trehalose/maltose import ATP-binding protein MalK [Candidatus Methanoplasma termitum]MCL2333331.1 ABC transporter ATP-binding protein [Candidatus Methanoplasma sp.]